MGDETTTQTLTQAWQDWTQWQAVMCVSSAAARWFFVHRPVSHVWGEVGLWCTGPGTASTLMHLGAPKQWLIYPEQGAERWDSEALWDLIQTRLKKKGKVLRVRGRERDAPLVQGQGRDWLVNQLTERGVQVHSVAAYERGVPTWSSQQCGIARAALEDGSVWWFTSAQAVTHVQHLLGPCEWGRARAVTTHERIARACQESGWGAVLLSAPDPLSVMKSIECFA